MVSRAQRRSAKGPSMSRRQNHRRGAGAEGKHLPLPTQAEEMARQRLGGDDEDGVGGPAGWSSCTA